jgi:hypothetical protein
MVRFFYFVWFFTLPFFIYGDENKHIFSFDKENIKKWRFIFDYKRECTCDLPKRFRTSHDVISDNDESLDLKGYADLNISGSGQFGRNEWTTLQKTLNSKFTVSNDNIYVIDLREEAHVFVNNTSITITSDDIKKDHLKFENFVGKSPDQIQIFEDELSRYLQSKKGMNVYKVIEKKETNLNKKYKKADVDIKESLTERDLVQKNGSHYIRFSVTDHRRPTDELVDSFLDFLNNLPKDSWLHFHCRGGVGRTSSFMLMMDIIKNGENLSLDTLVKRNLYFGGSKSLFDLKEVSTGKFKDGLVRRDFLIDFYSFVKDPNGYGKTKWSEWVKTKKTKS